MNQREDIINGLRELATYLEAHPELPITSVDAAAVPMTGTDVGDIAQVDQTAAALDVTPQWNDRRTHYGVERMFGGVQYRSTAITRDHMADYRAHMSYEGLVAP